MIEGLYSQIRAAALVSAAISLVCVLISVALAAGILGDLTGNCGQAHCGQRFGVAVFVSSVVLVLTAMARADFRNNDRINAYIAQNASGWAARNFPGIAPDKYSSLLILRNVFLLVGVPPLGATVWATAPLTGLELLFR